MSIKVMSAVWEHSPQKEGALFVLLALADCANDEGHVAWPSVGTLARKARLSERAVQYALRKLERDGDIERVGVHASGTTMYRVLLPGVQELRRGAKPAPVGCSDCTGGVQNIAPGGVQPTAPEPSYRTVIEHTSPDGDDAATPWAIFEAVCTAADQDIDGYTKRDKGRYLAVAKRLLAEGITVSEAGALVGWLRSQGWRTEPVTLFTVERELGVWRAAGRPAVAQARASPGASSGRTADGRLKVM